MPKGGILLCNIFPQTPAAAGADFRIPIGRMVLITVDRAFRTAPVGDKHKVIIRKHDPLFHTLHLTFYGLGNLLSAFKFKDHIGHFRVKPEINSCRFQIPLHRQDQGFILVILGELQCAEIRQPCNMMDKTLKIQFHFQCTVPVLKGKHSPPIQPERGIKHFLVKHILNGLVVQIFIPCHKKLHDLHAALLA